MNKQEQAIVDGPESEEVESPETDSSESDVGFEVEPSLADIFAMREDEIRDAVGEVRRKRRTRICSVTVFARRLRR